jgi:hypothetical protein
VKLLRSPKTKEELVECGVSINSIEATINLGKRHENARLINFGQAAWANHHDVGARMRTS